MRVYHQYQVKGYQFIQIVIVLVDKISHFNKKENLNKKVETILIKVKRIINNNNKIKYKLMIFDLLNLLIKFILLIFIFILIV